MSGSPQLTDIAIAVAQKHGLTGIAFCGKGAFKETFKATGSNGIVALKLIDRAKIDLDRTEREISALKRCNSRHIAKVFDSFVFTASAGRTFDIAIEEFFDGGSLEDRLEARKFSLPDLNLVGAKRKEAGGANSTPEGSVYL